MVALLDVNVLIALACPNHIHHSLALRWFRDNQGQGWATCPVTQAGFIRVSSNHRVIEEAPSPQEAALLLRRITALEHHEFWADDIPLVESEFFATERIRGYRQVTDAHLLALARSRSGRLATLDRRIRNLLPNSADDAAVCLLTDL
jgi:toxin-antitoxin system PIN domain toxin